MSFREGRHLFPSCKAVLPSHLCIPTGFSPCCSWPARLISGLKIGKPTLAELTNRALDEATAGTSQKSAKEGQNCRLFRGLLGQFLWIFGTKASSSLGTAKGWVIQFPQLPLFLHFSFHLHQKGKVMPFYFSAWALHRFWHPIGWPPHSLAEQDRKRLLLF